MECPAPPLPCRGRYPPNTQNHQSVKPKGALVGSTPWQPGVQLNCTLSSSMRGKPNQERVRIGAQLDRTEEQFMLQASEHQVIQMLHQNGELKLKNISDRVKCFACDIGGHP